MLGDYIRNCVSGMGYLVPELNHRPLRAIEQILSACRAHRAEDLTLIGSSLGGFYATVVAERLGCRAALINPAVHPHTHFERYLGPQRNLYSAEIFELTTAHLAELRALDVAQITHPERYWLFVETGDDVLDYREALGYFAGTCHTVIQGGDHSLASFPEHIPDIVDWAGSAASGPRAVLRS